jgi:excisionase family DNA binding protein
MLKESNAATVREAAHELNVCEQTIYRWLREGVLESRRFGRTIRIPRDSLDLRKRVVEAAAGEEAE